MRHLPVWIVGGSEFDPPHQMAQLYHCGPARNLGRSDGAVVASGIF
jgi:hypothetical protein